MPKGKDRPAADLRLDADRLACLVVHEIDLREAHEEGYIIPHLEADPDAAAHNLLRSLELVRRAAGQSLRPGLVVSVATAGDLLQWHSHRHLLTSDGGFAAEGRFVCLAQWDPTLLMSLFRERLLVRLLERHAISRELVQKLLAWRHPGFSAHVGEPIDPQDKQRLEDTASPVLTQRGLASSRRSTR